MIAELIRNSRKEKKLTRVQLSEMTGISISSLKNYEHGDFDPNISTLKIILDVLDIEMVFKVKEHTE